MRATMLLSATSNGVGVNVRLIWEWMDRLCKGLSIPRNQGIYNGNPLRIKVEVEDAGASPFPAPKITGTAVNTQALMSDVASLTAFVEAITVESAAVAAAAAESAVAAAAATMMGMVGGVTIQGSRARKITPSSLPWTSWTRRAVHLWIATSLGLKLRLLV
jgi:hypothetical protein